MVPVMQTIIPTADNPDLKGDCFRACVASIMEMPIDQVPHFCEHRNWEERLDDWLYKFGLAHACIRINVNADHGYHGPMDRGIEVLVGGRTNRHPTRLHSVVACTLGGGLQWEYTHDPHPDGTFLTEAVDLTWFVVRHPSVMGLMRTRP